VGRTLLNRHRLLAAPGARLTPSTRLARRLYPTQSLTQSTPDLLCQHGQSATEIWVQIRGSDWLRSLTRRAAP
jgi:hypothetical protein